MAFEPRTMVAKPGAFGNVSRDLPPADGIAVDDHRYRAAILQHRIARGVDDGLAYLEVSLPQFLTAFERVPGLSLDRQRRVLRGETSASFADVMFWGSHFRPVAAIATAYFDSLLKTHGAPAAGASLGATQGRPHPG